VHALAAGRALAVAMPSACDRRNARPCVRWSAYSAGDRAQRRKLCRAAARPALGERRQRRRTAAFQQNYRGGGEGAVGDRGGEPRPLQPRTFPVFKSEFPAVVCGMRLRLWEMMPYPARGAGAGNLLRLQDRTAIAGELLADSTFVST